MVRPVCRGEEINIDYGFDFYATPIEYREKRAATNYHFRWEDILLSGWCWYALDCPTQPRHCVLCLIYSTKFIVLST